MFINGVKITIVICLTIIVSCILFISYSEYVDRYTVVPTQDNSVYIFDKKTTALNKCNNEGCKSLETNLLGNSGGAIISQILNNPSSMSLGSEQTMTEEVVKAEAQPTANTKAEQNENASQNNNQQNKNNNKQQTPNKDANNKQNDNKNQQNNKKEEKKEQQSSNDNKPIGVKK